MNEMELDARFKKKFRVKTTDSSHSDPIAPRIIKTEVKETLPLRRGEVLAGDITYLKVGQKKFLRLIRLCNQIHTRF